MPTKHKNMLICQSGGPTAVINASLVGAFFRAIESIDIDRIYGGFNGIKGVLQEQLIDLGSQDKKTMEGIKFTPSSALGSSRYKLNFDHKNDNFERIFKVFDAHNIGYFFFNGGNDSMDTAFKIKNYADKIGYDIKVIGIPKTIDNDLKGTDNCPGFGSAVKYINTSILEAAFDCHTYQQDTILITEVMGRHSGWLAASTAMAVHEEKTIPDLIYLPEIEFNSKKFLNDVEKIYRKQKMVFITVSEGIKDKNGQFISAEKSANHDKFGHKKLGGVSFYLQQLIKQNICERVKVIFPGILQRSAAHIASKTDIDEAYWTGYRAVDYALKGYNGKMAAIKRISNKPFQWETTLVSLENVANKEKTVPRKWILPEESFVTEEIINYSRPLIQGIVQTPAWDGLPRYHTLNKKFVNPKLNNWKK